MEKKKRTSRSQQTLDELLSCRLLDALTKPRASDMTDSSAHHSVLPRSPRERERGVINDKNPLCDGEKNKEWTNPLKNKKTLALRHPSILLRSLALLDPPDAPLHTSLSLSLSLSLPPLSLLPLSLSLSLSLSLCLSLSLLPLSLLLCLSTSLSLLSEGIPSPL